MIFTVITKLNLFREESVSPTQCPKKGRKLFSLSLLVPKPEMKHRLVQYKCTVPTTGPPETTVNKYMVHFLKYNPQMFQYYFHVNSLKIY